MPIDHTLPGPEPKRNELESRTAAPTEKLDAVMQTIKGDMFNEHTPTSATNGSDIADGSLPDQSGPQAVKNQQLRSIPLSADQQFQFVAAVPDYVASHQNMMSLCMAIALGAFTLFLGLSGYSVWTYGTTVWPGADAAVAGDTRSARGAAQPA